MSAQNSKKINPASCLDLRKSGITTTGMYKLKLNQYSSTFQAFCDMETNGGGWTLVASVHENNMQGKCTTGDKWSDELDYYSSMNGTSGSANPWASTSTFGSPESANSEDYKNPAYFDLPASDVMIWHVPNNYPSHEWDQHVSLKYYTDNGFLSAHRNLAGLFTGKYAMERVPDKSTYDGVDAIMRSLNESMAELRNGVPDFYMYQYDGHNTIGDGGRDMYDDGNAVFFRIGDSGSYQQVEYDKTVSNLEVGVEYTSTTTHPFFTMAFIGNKNGGVREFSLKVESGTGADSDGRVDSFEGEINLGNFHMDYSTYNIHHALTDPSIIEVYFAIYNYEDWDSLVPRNRRDRFYPLDWSSTTDRLTNTVAMGGNPQNVLMGYTLLSKEHGGNVEELTVRQTLARILDKVSDFTKISGYNCSRKDESVITPVKFQVGDVQEVTAGVPPLQRPDVTGGFIQFRALSSKGFPYAICPGVQTDTCRASSVCIGGMNTMREDPGACGDFAGWDGNHSEEPGLEPAGNSRSISDINSSIFIFTRDLPPEPAPKNSKKTKKSG